MNFLASLFESGQHSIGRIGKLLIIFIKKKIISGDLTELRRRAEGRDKWK